MTAHNNTDDGSLPVGWTVKLKVRNNGKKDKFYFAPSSGLKFNSMAKVSEYLKSLQDVAEWLPPGWIKETKVKKKNQKIRRDSYYIDPVTGYIFYSMKDALRYVKTGEIGRLAKKPKGEGSNDVNLECDGISLNVVDEKPGFIDNSIRRQSIRIQSLKLKNPENADTDQSASRGECISLVEPTSEQCKDVVPAELSCSNLTDDDGSEKVEEKSESCRRELVSAPEVGVLETQPFKQKVMNPELRKMLQCKSRRKETNLPCRASKRLAELKVSPVEEVKSSNHAQCVTAKVSAMVTSDHADATNPDNTTHQSYNLLEPSEAGHDAQSTFNITKANKFQVEFNKHKHPLVALNNPEKCVKQIETLNKAGDNRQCTMVLPHSDPVVLEKRNSVDEKHGSPLNLTEYDCSDEVEERSESCRRELVSAPEVGVVETHSFKQKMMKPELKKMPPCKSRVKKETNLPCRASERLADLKVIPVEEVKSSNNPQSVTAKESESAMVISNHVDATNPDNSVQQSYHELESSEAGHDAQSTPNIAKDTTVQVELNKRKHPFMALDNPKKQVKQINAANKAEGEKESVLAPSDITVPEKGNNIDAPGSPLNLPFGDLLADPCIEFAIKTLTGGDFNTCKSAVLSTRFENDLANLTTERMNYTKVKGNTSNAGEAENDWNAKEKPGCTLELPFGDLRTDPCIDFAVKTLTGAIPVKYDVDIGGYFHSQVSSSKTQENSKLTFSSASDLFQTDVVCQQFNGASGPVYKRQVSSMPASSLNQSVSLKSTGEKRSSGAEIRYF